MPPHWWRPIKPGTATAAMRATARPAPPAKGRHSRWTDSAGNVVGEIVVASQKPAGQGVVLLADVDKLVKKP